MLVAGVSCARWEKVFAGRPRKPALCSGSFAAVNKGHGSTHSCGSGFATRCWNIFDRNAVVEPFRTNIGITSITCHLIQSTEERTRQRDHSAYAESCLSKGAESSNYDVLEI
jgi:hypothetical protein